MYLAAVLCMAEVRHFTAADGLPTSEVQQIVELPGGQMLVNCEGVFCISNGHTFDPVPFDRTRAYILKNYVSTYGQMWQGDSLLWLHDMYCLYLFDARTRSFRYDIAPRLRQPRQQCFAECVTGGVRIRRWQWRIVDSLGINGVDAVATDRNGGHWIGTRNEGLYYLPPRRYTAEVVNGALPLIAKARSTVDSRGGTWHCTDHGVAYHSDKGVENYDRSNVDGLPHDKTTFITQLADGRYLLCDSLCYLGYFMPSQRRFQALNSSIPSLRKYRHFVGACPVDGRQVAVYTQNGAFMLDVVEDVIRPFPHAESIERYSNKYNCMLKDGRNRLWVGTQNGLFCLTPVSDKGGGTARYSCERIGSLANNCIRSLVLDGHGGLWAGTSCGVSRITPTVVNLGEADGVPEKAMMERATTVMQDGRLVFVFNALSAVVFRPDDIIGGVHRLNVMLTAMQANGEALTVKSDSMTVTLPYNRNFLTFQFSALYYANPMRVRYRYRLRGLETEWNTVNGTDGNVTASYTALPPGDYVLEAQAAMAGGQWGGTMLCEVTITPPLWLSWWAKVLYLLLAVCVTALLLHLYLKMKRKKLEQENEDRVNRLFELRSEARHHFAQSANIAPEKLGADTEEEALVAQMLKAIERNLSVEDYGVDQLAYDVAMSRASLYKKLQAMLGVTPADFIRNVRLKRAAQLLAETQLSINEIASKVGFVTPRNFSANFKKMFGVTPSEYRRPDRPTEETE